MGRKPLVRKLLGHLALRISLKRTLMDIDNNKYFNFFLTLQKQNMTLFEMRNLVLCEFCGVKRIFYSIQKKLRSN